MARALGFRGCFDTGNVCKQWQCEGDPVTKLGFPGGSDSKESAWNAGDLGSIPQLGRSPGGVHGNPLQYFCLENPHGQRNLSGYSPYTHKESDMAEHMNSLIFSHTFYLFL